MEFGWTWKSVPTLMFEMGTRRKDTVRLALNALEDAGVIQRRRRHNQSSQTFVDLDALITYQQEPVKAASSQDDTESVPYGDSDDTEDVVSGESTESEGTVFVATDDTESVPTDNTVFGSLSGFEVEVEVKNSLRSQKTFAEDGHKSHTKQEQFFYQWAVAESIIAAEVLTLAAKSRVGTA